MADPNQTPGQSRPASALRANAAPPASDAVASVLGAAAGIGGGDAAQESEVGTQQDNAAAGSAGNNAASETEIEVDWQGAKRRMKSSDLVAMARRAEEAERQRDAMKEVVTKNAVAEQFIKALDSMPEEDRNAFHQVLANPSLARGLTVPRGTQQPEPNEEPDDDEVDRSLRPKAQNGAQQRNGHQALTSDERSQLQLLLQERQQRMAQEAHQTLAGQVEATMASYPIFGENEPASKYARQAILMHLATNPGAKIDDVVAQHAVAAHGILQAERQAYSPPPSGLAAGGVSRVRTFQPPDLDKPPTGDDLASGRLGKQLLAAWRSRPQ